MRQEPGTDRRAATAASLALGILALLALPALPDGRARAQDRVGPFAEFPVSGPPPSGTQVEKPWPWGLLSRRPESPNRFRIHVHRHVDPAIWLFPNHPKYRRGGDPETIQYEDFLNEAEKTTFGAQQGGNRSQPSLIGPLINPLDPALLHWRLDEALGFDTRKVSHLPKAPELPEALFYDLMRPLGALKYDNETNYLIASFTGSEPTLQLLELEYMAADWRAVELQLNWDNGQFAALVPGYQRTLGVGPEGNWVHAYQIQVPIFFQSGIVGGRAAYFFGWQPDRESPFGAYLIAGAERVAVEESGGRSHPIGPVGTFGLTPPGGGSLGASAAGRAFGVWRPLAAIDLFYTLNERLSVGLESDAFIDDHYGNYIILPQIQWQPLVHVTIKAGAGWYEFGGEGQAIFSARVMITQPTPRRSYDDHDPNPGRNARAARGMIGRWLGGRRGRAARAGN